MTLSIDYEHLSAVYDRLLYDVSGSEWVAYLRQLMPEGGPQKLLEYACGSGRLTQEFLRNGHAVIGVDRAEGMLSQAAAKLRPLGPRLQLACADMTDFRLIEPVDAAVCGMDAVNYLTDEEQLRAFFAGAAANLRDGGTFLFDISTPHRLKTTLGDEFYYDDGDEQTLFWQNHYDEQSGLLEMTLTIFLLKGSLYDRFDEVHVLRPWTEAEIRKGLEEAGFTDIEVFAFGTMEPPAADSSRIQFRAVKGAHQNA